MPLCLPRLEETAAITSLAVPLSPSHEEPHTAQGLGAPVSPCDPSFLQIHAVFLQCEESLQQGAQQAGKPLAPTAPAQGVCTSPGVSLQNLMRAWWDVGVPNLLEAGDLWPLLVPVPTATRSSIYLS